MNKTLFYDTCSLLTLQRKIFEGEKFYISSISINELENIKSSSFKDEETKYKARTLLQLLEKNEDKYEIILYQDKFKKLAKHFSFNESNDIKIISCALFLQKRINNLVFVTHDLVCKNIAKSLGLPVSAPPQEQKEKYTGFLDINLTESELASFYNDYGKNKNTFSLLENQYLILRTQGEIIAKYKWKDNKYEPIHYQKVESKMFGKIAPKNGDIYQQLALDSLNNNKITMLRGAAGTGKSILSFGYMFSLLEKGNIDKIIIFCNTVATKGSAKLGFYPGSRTEKLLDSQIGNLLESKLGGRLAVEQLIDDNRLILLPLSDIRGYDTSGMNAAIYISEAQNLDIELMRLALQRIGDDSICILDGDFTHQVDMNIYAGSNNGMKRVSEVFRGQPFYGEIELQTIYRSDIAKVAELM